MVLIGLGCEARKIRKDLSGFFVLATE